MKVLGLVVSGAVGGVAIAGAGGLAVWFGVETATVEIAPPMRYVDARTTLHGDLAGGQFKTQRLQVTLTETIGGTATGIGRTQARFATGYVVFNHNCGQPAPGKPCLPTPPVSAGAIVSNTQGTMGYVLLAQVSCFCGESIPVRAYSPGSIGNTTAHTISLYAVRGHGFTPWETADNPAPISGGLDSISYAVVTQSDLDRVRGILESRLTADLDSSLRAKAGPLHYIAEPPTFSTSTNFGVGAHSPTFQITGSGSLTATAFADADARTLIAKAVVDDVPSGWRLIEAPWIMDYEVLSSTAEGNVTLIGTAQGHLIEQVSTGSLPSRLRGLSSQAAVDAVLAYAPGSKVEIRISPVTLPWLPLNPEHISVTVSQAI